jgi:very-long-chain (3R)-3-hydroxyacyl-CoA dehydratase
MVGSWTLVEVPRYAFYAANELTEGGTEGVPWPIFWLRYSLFYCLYPTGISGEMLQIAVSLPHWASAAAAATAPAWESTGANALLYGMGLLFALYFVLGPFMVLNMHRNRRRAFQRRREALGSQTTNEEKKKKH